MTVVVGTAAPDGIILAAESRTTVTLEARHRVASDATQKLFPLLGQIGLATYGDAFIGRQTIAGLIDEFVTQLGNAATEVGEVAKRLGEFFDARLRGSGVYPSEDLDKMSSVQAAVVGFLVAGYDEEGIGRIVEVRVPGPTVLSESVVDTATLGICWRGQTDVIGRLIKGIDSTALAVQAIQVPDDVTAAFEKLEYNLILPITLQDAVDLATFLIRTTIDMQRFSDGTFGRLGEVPGCGGPIRVLAVTRDGVSWVGDPPLPAAPAAPISP